MSMMRYISFLICFLIFLFSCKKDNEENIPEAAVEFTITVANYPDLIAVNGYEYVSGGVQGIIIYRYTTEEFKAYDRNCSYQPYDDCAKVSVDSSGILAKDDCCGSEFQLLDGAPVSSPATKLLKQYSTEYDGIQLRVYN